MVDTKRKDREQDFSATYLSKIPHPVHEETSQWKAMLNTISNPSKSEKTNPIPYNNSTGEQNPFID